MNVLKGGWHPGGGKANSSSSSSSTTGGYRGKLSELKGKATGKPVDKHDYDAARSHQSAPLSSLRDPASFAPPPKHSAYYGNNAQSQAVTRTGTTASSSVAAAEPPAPPLGGQLVETGYAQRRAAEKREAQEQAELEAAKPKGPYRADTSGLRTDNLPPPPVKRVTTDTSAAGRGPPTPARRASPALPPRVPPRQSAAPPPSLPPRQNEYPDEHTPPPPPAYQEAISQPAPAAHAQQPGMINQSAANRLGQAGVSVAGFGIGGGNNSTIGNSNASPAQPTRNYGQQIGQLGELHQRFNNSSTNNAATGGSPPARGYGQQVGQLGELQQRFSKMNAGSADAPSSPSHAQTAQNALAGVAAAAQKKPPPPPPPKKSGLAPPAHAGDPSSPASGNAPPPLPLSSKPKPF